MRDLFRWAGIGFNTNDRILIVATAVIITPPPLFSILQRTLQNICSTSFLCSNLHDDLPWRLFCYNRTPPCVRTVSTLTFQPQTSTYRWASRGAWRYVAHSGGGERRRGRLRYGSQNRCGCVARTTSPSCAGFHIGRRLGSLECQRLSPGHVNASLTSLQFVFTSKQRCQPSVTVAFVYLFIFSKIGQMASACRKCNHVNGAYLQLWRRQHLLRICVCVCIHI